MVQIKINLKGTDSDSVDYSSSLSYRLRNWLSPVGKGLPTRLSLWSRFKRRSARRKAEKYLRYAHDASKCAILVKGLGDGRQVVYVEAYDSALSLFEDVPVHPEACDPSLQVPEFAFGLGCRFVGAFAASSLFHLGKQAASPHLGKLLDRDVPLLNATWAEYKKYTKLSESPRFPHSVGMKFVHARPGVNDPLQQLIRRACFSLILLKKFEDEAAADYARSLRENDLGFFPTEWSGCCPPLFEWSLSLSIIARWTLGEIPDQYGQVELGSR